MAQGLGEVGKVLQRGNAKARGVTITQARVPWGEARSDEGLGLASRGTVRFSQLLLTKPAFRWQGLLN